MADFLDIKPKTILDSRGIFREANARSCARYPVRSVNYSISIPVFSLQRAGLYSLVDEDRLISTHEFLQGAQAVSDEVKTWAKCNKAILTIPTAEETLIVSMVFR